MRFAALIIALLLTQPALSADWSSYENGRFGYSIDIPPGFTSDSEADNGDGRLYRGGSTFGELAVWGGNVVEDDFMAEYASRLSGEERDSLNITYEASTPTWGSFSGTRGGIVIYLRMISLCDGAQYGSFRLAYFVADIAEFDPLVTRMVQSFRETGNGESC